MLFSSVTFLFFFLPITLLLFFFLRNRPAARNVFLLVVSLVFYYVGEKAYTILLLAVHRDELRVRPLDFAAPATGGRPYSSFRLSATFFR